MKRERTARGWDEETVSTKKPEDIRREDECEREKRENSEIKSTKGMRSTRRGERIKEQKKEEKCE